MSWNRHVAKVLADSTLAGAALTAALEDRVRMQNPHFTDVRLQRATATEDYDTGVHPPGRWYEVSYAADDGEGY